MQYLVSTQYSVNSYRPVLQSGTIFEAQPPVLLGDRILCALCDPPGPDIYLDGLGKALL